MSLLFGSLPAVLFLPLGARTLLSGAGIGLIVSGVWEADRSWDEKASAAYYEAQASGATKSAANEKTPLTAVQVPQEKLDAAFPFPWKFLLGWSLFGLSFFSSATATTTTQDASGGLVLTVGAAVSAAASLALGWIASIPMADAVKNRKPAKKQALSMAFLSSWVVLTVATAWESPTAWHTVLRAAGAVSIIASMKILWQFRKMGDTWESAGQPNPNPVVYNMGGPLFCIGWFLFWLGMATVTTEPADAIKYIPFYATWRTVVAFLSGVGMVPIVMMVDYAHDEGAEWLGFGTDGRFFGRFLESPIPFVGAWAAFGLASLLDQQGIIKPLQYVVVGNCVAQGLTAGILIQNALYRGDLAAKTKYSIPFVLLFLGLATEIGVGNGWYILSVPGAMLIILGQKTVFGDRKRGDYWMENNKTVNPNPIVYSYGEIYFTTGWILISTAMAIPFH